MESIKKKLYKCTYPGCDKVFNKRCVLRDHLYAHEKKKPFKCDICQKTFTQKGNLNTHKKIHSSNNGGFICPFPKCGKSYVTNSYLKIHLKSHKGQKECICTYPGCGKKFYHRGNLKYHERKNHPNLKSIFPFECLHSNCNKKFSNIEDKLNSHYEYEPDCKKEKYKLFNLFGEMVELIRKEGDIQDNKEVNEIYHECLKNLNGKELIVNYMKEHNIYFDDIENNTNNEINTNTNINNDIKDDIKCINKNKAN